MNTLKHVKNNRIDCFVHSDGRVYTYHSVWRKFLLHKTYIDTDGYIRLSIQGKNIGLHQLLALAFIPNPDCKTTVDHIDRNKLNNDISNLRWATVAEQNRNKEHHKLPDDIREAHKKESLKRSREKHKREGKCRLFRDGKWQWLDLSERILSRGNRYTENPITKRSYG